MNKELYMKSLKKKLRRLPKAEFEKAVAYFEEYFEEAGPDQEEQAILDLGTPEEAAHQIIQNIAIENTKEPIRNVKKGINAVWVGILAVFAAPVALPFIVMALALALILLASAAIIFAVLFACGVLIILMGPVCIWAGFTMLTTSLPAALICFGQGLSGVGIGLLLVWGVYFFIRKCINWLVAFFGKMVKKGGKTDEKSA